MIDITQNELLAALNEAARVEDGNPFGALTSVEIAEAMGAGVERTRKMIRAGVNSGLVLCVRVRKSRIDGAITLVPAYYVAGSKPVG